jgi:hypothetical protein
MEQLWTFLYERCLASVGPAVARRVANVALAATLAAKFGPSGDGGETSPNTLIKQLADQLGFQFPSSLVLPWKEIERDPKLAAIPTDTSGFDRWIEAFQAADAGRKSLGAFATPKPLADQLAASALSPLLDRSALRIVDPSAGAGSLLMAAQRYLHNQGVPPVEAATSLFGVELDPAARDLCVLLIWLSSGKSADVSIIARNIVCGDALTRDWWTGSSQFDCVLMNPPWESLRHQPSHAEARAARDSLLAMIDKPTGGARELPPLYSAHGRGDRNLFKAFVELAPHLLREGGRLGALLPAAFGSDDGMAQLRQRYLSIFRLEKWTTFENRKKLFPIDSRYKFGLLSAARDDRGTDSFFVKAFSSNPDDVHAPHVLVSGANISEIGGRDLMIPELVHEYERDVLLKMIRGGTPLFERGPLQAVSYRREIDLTLGKAAGKFVHVDQVSNLRRTGPRGVKAALVPLVEGRMVGRYDCFEKSWVCGAGRSAVWRSNGDEPLSSCKPQYVTEPASVHRLRIALCDVTSATNARTVLAALVPTDWVCGNTAPVLEFEDEDCLYAGLAILNSMIFDWAARRTVGGLHLNKFYLARLPWPNLEPAQVALLAQLGRRLASAHPRGGVPTDPMTHSKRIDLEARIEAQVAAGYNLDARDLGRMLKNDRDDRRGHWRMFASNPDALQAAELALKKLNDSAHGESMLSAA